MGAGRYVELCGEFLAASAALAAAAEAGDWEGLAPLLAQRAAVMAAVDRLGLDLARMAGAERQAALRCLEAAREWDCRALAALQKARAEGAAEMGALNRAREFLNTYVRASVPAGRALFLDARR